MNNKTHWESVYQNKSPLEVSWYQAEPVMSLALIQKLALQADDHVIDVGGGASTLVDGLLAASFKNITVLDLSANALAYSQQRLAEQAAQVNWVVEDVTHYMPAHRFALWHDRAVFHFLTDAADREKYQHVLNTAVKAGGYVIIAAFAINGPSKCSGLNIVQYDAAKIQAELGAEFLLIEQHSEKHLTPSGNTQAFEYFVFVKK